MKYTETPDIEYVRVDKVETEDPAAFVAFLSTIPEETPVAWFSHKDDGAHPGVWMRRGMYKLKHGSFVDPSDLSCYGAQYYEAFDGGRHECVQIGRSPQVDRMPADVIPAPTVGDLISAIRELVPLPVSEDVQEADEADVQTDGVDVAAAEAATPGTSEATDAASAAQPALKFLQPDYAFEFHGALTRGWHAQIYHGEDAEGNGVDLLVLR